MRNKLYQGGAMTYNINAGEILTKVSFYSLIRGETRLPIVVHKIISGDYKRFSFQNDYRSECEYFAFPDTIRGATKTEFIGYGKTEQEALNNCLRKVVGISFPSLFEEIPDFP
jgi:hypothetical protein